ncbi:MAG: ABC transporter ATP-binding protein [Chloroflexi bacterium]|nr:ABC transporter ATP-binding protein [Chloroflexota bacterium]
MTAKLALRDIVVRRGNAEILRVLQLDVTEGEVLAVLGPNGAGKSTLLQVLALLERPAQGEVLFDGSPVAGRELKLRRQMAAVFQESLLLDRSVAANIALGLSLRGMPRGQRRERVHYWLHRFGVDDLADRSGRHLSGGEAQRVSLARAFVLEPSIILLDEPFSALDQPTRESLADELVAVLSETGITAVFVTHERDEAARLADRVAVIVDGQVQQIGPTAEVFSSPADETVAAYVGVETVAPAKVLESHDGLVVLSVGYAHVEATANGFKASEALVCLRPEDIVLSVTESEIQTSVRNRLRGTVTGIKPAGAEVRVEADCGFPLVASITRRSLEELGIAIGTPVTASFKATAVHLIPRGT